MLLAHADEVHRSWLDSALDSSGWPPGVAVIVTSMLAGLLLAGAYHVLGRFSGRPRSPLPGGSRSRRRG